MHLYQVQIEGVEFEIYRFPYELVDSNMYFIPSGDTGVVIDPNENEELLDVFKDYGTKSVVIVLTHEHYDHTSGVLWLQSKIESKLFCHQACAEAIATEKGNNPKTVGILLSVRDAVDGGHRFDDYMAVAKSYLLHADETFDGIHELRVGDLILKCFAAPGHSPGSAIYILGEQCVFTGDSLIQHTPTILRLPGSDRTAFKQVTQPFLRSLDHNMTVFPGHEEPFKINEAQYL